MSQLTTVTGEQLPVLASFENEDYAVVVKEGDILGRVPKAALQSDESFVLSGYGPVDNPANSLATTNAALAAQGRGGSLLIDAPVRLTAIPTDPGVEKIGQFPVTVDSGDGQGKRVLNHAGASLESGHFGHNQLFVWRNLIRAFGAGSIATPGDSNTAGFAGAIIQSMLSSIPGQTVTNYGVGGSTLDNWINNTGTVNGTGFHMAAVIAAAPKLIILGYGGTNEPYFGRTLAQYDNDLDIALTAIRAALPRRNCSILLLSASTQNDGAGGRDESFVHEARAAQFRAARKHGCAWFDKLAIAPDASVDYGAGANQNTELDAARVHTQPALSAQIAGALIDWLIPKGFAARAVIGDSPMVASSDFVILASDGPSKWPKGGTLTTRALPADGWPLDGFVTTDYHREGTAPIQRCWSYNQGIRLVRHYDQSVGVWRNWVADGLVDLTASPATHVAATAISDFPCGHSSVRALPADGWPLDGYVYTTREPNQGTYGTQQNFSYSADVPAQQRHWTSVVPGWGAWHPIW